MLNLTFILAAYVELFLRGFFRFFFLNSCTLLPHTLHKVLKLLRWSSISEAGWPGNWDEVYIWKYLKKVYIFIIIYKSKLELKLNYYKSSHKLKWKTEKYSASASHIFWWRCARFFLFTSTSIITNLSSSLAYNAQSLKFQNSILRRTACTSKKFRK